jgi:hypothetical protein
MTESVEAIIRRETRISLVINLVLSGAFFLAVFGVIPRPLTLAAPDNLALDFLPQSLAIGFFSALVPALLVNGKRRKGLIVGLDNNAATAMTTLFRALGFAAIAALAGAAIALLLPMIITQIGYFAAFAVKLFFGGLLAGLITPRALRRSLRS